MRLTAKISRVVGVVVWGLGSEAHAEVARARQASAVVRRYMARLYT